MPLFEHDVRQRLASRWDVADVRDQAALLERGEDGVVERVGVARQKRRPRAAHLVVLVERGGARRRAERLEAFDGVGLVGAGSVRNLI